MALIHRLSNPIAEGSSAKVTATIEDLDGIGFKPTTLTLLLYDQVTGTVINSRDRVSILDANGGTVSAAGALVLELSPDDNVIAGSPPNELERHVALLEWTWNAGAREGRAEIHFVVRDMSQVPAS